jgi:hypothetical protein
MVLDLLKREYCTVKVLERVNHSNWHKLICQSAGGAPIITAVPFSIDGRTVKVFAHLGTLGNPSSFKWNAATRPGVAVNYVDFAPDSGLVSWTR